MKKRTATKQFAEEKLPPKIQEIAERMNVDPKKIPSVRIPALPFDSQCGPADFLGQVRKGLLQPFIDRVYGIIPPRCEKLFFRITSEGTAFGGLALRREIDIVCGHHEKEQTFHLLLYIPTGKKGPVPVFFGLNFLGNHSTVHDPEVLFHPFRRYPALIPGSLRWRDRRAAENERGCQAYRWETEQVLQAGFATATMCYGDIYPDHPHGFPGSIMRFYHTAEEWSSPERKSGAISAWAWGIMRGIDCLESQPELDLSRLIVHGHSRLGKTALWAGANDPRIALTVANGSGACGAKLMHHYYGENYEWLNLWNFYWFRGNFPDLSGKDLILPFDFHYLLAAIAPRLLYISDGDTDIYADAKGEFACCRAASQAWRIFSASGLGRTAFPPNGKLTGNEIGFYLRQGGHDFTPENWTALLKFVRRHFPQK